MKKVISWPYFDPDYENLTERIYGPPCRVSIDNESMHDCTVVKVDSVKKQGLLLEVVQVLTDMNLQISKGYISSDCGWFMDVFHVKDEHGNKLRDQRLINSIQQAIGAKRGVQRPPAEVKANSSNNVMKSGDLNHSNEHTAIEMTGTDRPGLFSEISAALRDLHCNIVEAHAWSHNAHLACVAYISDQCTDTPIDDPHRLATIEDHLNMVLRAPIISSTTTHQAPHTAQQEVKTSGLNAQGGEGRSMISNMERRLHQLMLSVRDFDEPLHTQSSSIRVPNPNGHGDGENPEVSIEECHERGYSIVNIKCKDRPRLMFDTVCTLTDMQYVIFHASITSSGANAFQEYFIRHIDGYALSTASEKERVVKCIEAAIERRVCEGLRLEVCANNRIGLLSDITRVLRENGLTVVRADVATEGEKAVNAFYVRDISGNKVDMDCFIECVKKEMGPVKLAIKNHTHTPIPKPTTHPESENKPNSPPNYSFGEKLKSRIIGRLSPNFITTNQ